MATIYPIEAGRRKPQNSTATRTASGSAEAWRPLKSATDPESLTVDGEDGEVLEALISEYFERYRPVTPEQRFYVDTLIQDEWILRRLRRAETEIWQREFLGLDSDETHPLAQSCHYNMIAFGRLQTRINALERSYRAALRELERLQRRDPPPSAPVANPVEPRTIGFNPGIPSEQADRVPPYLGARLSAVGAPACAVAAPAPPCPRPAPHRTATVRERLSAASRAFPPDFSFPESAPGPSPPHCRTSRSIPYPAAAGSRT